MLENWARRVTAKLVAGIAILLRGLGLEANVLTVIGCALQLAVGVLLAYGYQQLGGFLLALGASCDAIDGALARETGGTTKFGAFLDSVLDRVAESAVLAGLGWWYMVNQNPALAMLAYLAMICSLLVSYARARAEAIGVECKVGFFSRGLRVILLVTALVLGWTNIGVLILAAGSLITVGHRIVYVYIQTRHEALSASQVAPISGAKPATQREP